MKTSDYLNEILEYQSLFSNTSDSDSPELKVLREEKKIIASILESKFGCDSFKLYNGGSYIKNTMVKVSYDFDLPCYFYQGNTAAGSTLKEIYGNIGSILESNEEYQVEYKNSAIAIKKLIRESGEYKYTHLDIVPGRFTSEDPSKDSDANLYQKFSDKNWLKTNTGVQIRFIRDSGLTSVIRLLKIWRNHISLNKELKTFILELLCIKICSEFAWSSDYEGALLHFWTVCSNPDTISKVAIEDPANPQGNLLTDAKSDVLTWLIPASQKALQNINNGKWNDNFESILKSGLVVGDSFPNILTQERTTFSQPAKPWAQ